MSAGTLRRWCDEGRVPCRRGRGGQRLFSAAELDRLALARQHFSAAEDQAPLAPMDPWAAGAVATGGTAGPVCGGQGGRRPPAKRSARGLLAEHSLPSLVAEAVADLTSSLDSDHVWHVAAQRLCTLLDVPACDLYACQGDALVCLGGVGPASPRTAPEGRELQAADWATFLCAVRARGPVAIEDLDDPLLMQAERAILRDAGVLSILVTPVLAGEDVIGLVRLNETRRHRLFKRAEIETAQSICRIAGLAIRNARLYERQQTQTRRLSTMLSATRAISSALRLEDVLNTVSLQAALSLNVTGTGIYEWDRQADTVICRSCCAGGEIVDDDVGQTYPLAEHQSDRLVLEQNLVLNESVSDPDLMPDSRESMERHGERRALTLPLVFKDDVLGELVLTDTQLEEPFSAEDVEFARALSDQAAVAMHNASLYRELEERTSRLDSLLNAGRALSSSLDLSDVLHTLTECALEALGCRECVLFEYDEATDTIRERVALVEDDDYQPWTEAMPLEAYPGARELLADGELLVETLSDPDLDEAVRADMSEWGEKTCLSLPLIHDERRLGFMVLIETEEERRFSTSELELARGLAQQASLALHNARVYDDLRRLHVANLRTLSAAVGAKDLYTQGHASRVTAYMLLLGRELGWPVDYLQRVEEAAMLHDVGKLAVSDRVLLKPGPLYEEEWQLMRQHPVTSAEITGPMLEEEFVRAIRHHHERYDGAGYPDGLAGDDIPLLARALSVADAYDAMSLPRPYRAAATYADCTHELMSCSGTQFDPAIVTAFLRVLDRLQSRKAEAMAIADEAAAAIDPEEHERLGQDEERESPEHAHILEVLQAVRERHPSAHCIVTLRRSGSDVIVVAGTGGDACGHTAFGEAEQVYDEFERVWAGELPDINTVHDDEFGVWVIGLAPVTDANGHVVAVVRAAFAADEALEGSASHDSTRAFTTVLGETLRRISKAEIEAITDGLTGLYNHRYFHERLAQEIQRARDHEGRVALLFADIDHFKHFNDRRGHRAGDAALRAVARIIESCTRRTDVVARYGGEEFVAALLDCDQDGALEIAERIRDRVAAGEAWSGIEGLTVSIGVAAFPEDAAGKDELVDKADWARYLAKRRGRDQVVSFAQNTLHPGQTGGGREALPVGTLTEMAAGAGGYETETGDQVPALARHVAERLALPEGEIWWTSEAARLRNIGYVGIPEEALDGHGEPTGSDLTFLRQHPVTGERLLLHLGYPPAVVEAVGQHHELLDGSGYPRGLSAPDICLPARIVVAAAEYHAMIGGRWNRRRLSPEQALAELRSGAGRRFDAAVVAALAQVVTERLA